MATHTNDPLKNRGVIAVGSETTREPNGTGEHTRKAARTHKKSDRKCDSVSKNEILGIDVGGCNRIEVGSGGWPVGT